MQSKSMMIIKISILTGLLLTTLALARDSNFYVYLCFGQSNMEGQGAIESQDRVVNSRFKVLQAVDCSNLHRNEFTWYPAVPPLCRCWNGLSPADYFGRTMIENLPDSITIGVINVAIGGCRIELFDKAVYQDFDSTYTEDWFQNALASYGGNPYQHLVDLAKQAQQDGVIKGILLHQGESNTGDIEWPSKVKIIYDNLMVDLDLAPENIPLLAGEVVHEEQNGCCYVMNDIIATLPETLPNSFVVSSKGCSVKSDNTHFDSEGYREFGKRYAYKMLATMGITPTAVQGNATVAEGYSLEQNHPNPFNPETAISFQLPVRTHVNLTVYDMAGRTVEVLIDGTVNSGTHSISFDATDIPSGVYTYQLKTDTGFLHSKKMVLVK